MTPAAATHPNTVLFGAGEIWIDLADAEGRLTGERYAGDSSRASLTTTRSPLRRVTRRDGWRPGRALLERDADDVVRRLRVALRDSSIPNWALWLAGDQRRVALDAGWHTGLVVGPVALGRWYQLGQRPENPAGLRALTPEPVDAPRLTGLALSVRAGANLGTRWQWDWETALGDEIVAQRLYLGSLDQPSLFAIRGGADREELSLLESPFLRGYFLGRGRAGLQAQYRRGGALHWSPVRTVALGTPAAPAPAPARAWPLEPTWLGYRGYWRNFGNTLISIETAWGLREDVYLRGYRVSHGTVPSAPVVAREVTSGARRSNQWTFAAIDVLIAREVYGGTIPRPFYLRWSLLYDSDLESGGPWWVDHVVDASDLPEWSTVESRYARVSATAFEALDTHIYEPDVGGRAVRHLTHHATRAAAESRPGVEVAAPAVAEGAVEVDDAHARIRFLDPSLAGRWVQLDARTEVPAVDMAIGDVPAVPRRGAVRYIEQPGPGGPAREIYAPHCILRPAGAVELKSRTDPQTLELDALVLTPEDGRPGLSITQQEVQE